MFDENFSFLSSASTTSALRFDDCASLDISPLTSRSSSPGPYLRKASIHTRSTQPLSRRDERYNSITSMPRNPSITALTAQLECHVLSSSSMDTSPLGVSPTSTHCTTPSSADFSDEGFVDGPNSATTSDLDSDIDAGYWDLSSADLSLTSSPRDSFHSSSFPSFSLRRRQRQALVRLQCVAQRAPDLMMLIEERHPSSLPLSDEPLCTLATKRAHSLSTSSLSSGRVEKERALTAVKRTARMRKRSTR